jgi:16S rRNA (guanine1207-N2)-methyltransferase
MSNPPIRVGKTVLHDLLGMWLARLRPDGSAHLVVQKHLGSDSLQRWLIEQGWTAERIASRKSFRVLRIQARES